MRRPTVLAGVGGIAFGVLTFAAVVLANPPGGGYSASQVADYLAKGHRVGAIVAMYLGWFAVFGLICLLAHLRAAANLAPGHEWATSIFWGTGLAAAASFAVGWGVVGGQVIAHLEGGSGVTIPPPTTYLVSEVGVIFIFGAGAALLGIALVVLMLAVRTTLLPGWLRWLTVIAGLCGIAGPAFFTFFLLLAWGVLIGIWLIASREPARASV
jgi:hypothetical protein